MQTPFQPDYPPSTPANRSATAAAHVERPSRSLKRTPRLLQGFYDLPIAGKTLLITLLMLISMGGMIGLGAMALVKSLRTQLLSSTQSQLAVTELNYNSALAEMELGFASQAENPALVAATVDSTNGRPLTLAMHRQIQSILRHEIKIRKIEYATLVGKDFRIIVNANADRTGQVFNPNNLVRIALQNRGQISSSEIVSWSELKTEDPPLPGGLTNQDALIRYTITPIKAPGTQSVIGALVAGDIVNGKTAIVKQTVEAFQGVGYSAVYLHQPKTGNFSLAASFQQTQLRKPKFNQPLNDKSLLQAAVEAKGKPVSARSPVDGHLYTLASKAIPNYEGEEVAVLVYGDPELALHRIIQDSLLAQIGLSVLALVVVLILTWAIGEAIAKPIKRLSQAASEFSEGNYQARAEMIARDEVGQLAGNFNEMADNIERNDRRIRQETEMFRFLAELSMPLSHESQALDEWFERVLASARALVGADRLLLYRLSSDGSGAIAYESVAPEWLSIRHERIQDGCIPAETLAAYRQERVTLSSNIYETDWHRDHLQLLERLQVKANLVIPILTQGQLYGLLIAHQCAYPRQWQETDINFLKQLVTQLQVTLDRWSLTRQKTLETRLSACLKAITLKISRSFNVESLFDLAVQDSKAALETDRVIVFAFDENWRGTIIAEAVSEEYPTALGTQIADPCFAERYVEQYRQGRVNATPDVHKARLSACHLKQLDPFAIKANLVAPILVAGDLFGLLIAHHCQAPKLWNQAEIDFFTQAAIQVGVALERANLLDEQTFAEEKQRQAKEQLQKRALELLMEVDPISHGDLTVRAKVTNDEIGTIADSYNSTVENLRHLVTQVQAAAQELGTTTDDNDALIQTLANESLRQALDISQAAKSLNAMTDSSQAVVTNAELALLAVRQATKTVEAGETAMNQTVDGISAIRNTVTETSKKIQNLGDSSQKISKVVSLIGRFAAQTHLLALKASIEAARAGEGGRGFAVIADEVRGLAAQSAEATAEIEALVASIQLETKEVAQTMEMGTQQVLFGSHLVDETRKSLTQITTASTRINHLVESIAQSAIEQSQTSQSVTQVMEEVAAVTQHTSTSASQVSESFQKLLVVAQQLQASVDRFKVH